MLVLRQLRRSLSLPWRNCHGTSAESTGRLETQRNGRIFSHWHEKSSASQYQAACLLIEAGKIHVWEEIVNGRFNLVIIARRTTSPSASWPAPAAESISIPVESTASASASTSAKFPRFLLAGFIDSQRASVQDLSIQLIDGCFHVCLRSQFRESKAPGPSCAGIANYPDTGYGNIHAGKKLS
jgi:hypothetical protein